MEGAAAPEYGVVGRVPVYHAQGCVVYRLCLDTLMHFISIEGPGLSLF